MSYKDVPQYARTSKRVTITIPFHVFSAIVERSSEEGRSISNLMAYLLERAIDAGKF
jgi:predicted DNA binding CopG/RHH family protein